MLRYVSGDVVDQWPGVEATGGWWPISNSQQRLSLCLLQAPCPFLFSFSPLNPMSFSEFLLSVDGYFVYPVKNLRGLVTLSLQGPSKATGRLKLFNTNIFYLCKLLFKSDS